MRNKEEFFDLEQNYLHALPKNKDAAILDFGCGSGRVIKFLVSKGYAKITGVDIVSRDWEDLKNTNATLIKIDNAKEYLLSQKENFDFVIAKDVIYYFDTNDARIILGLLAESLKPGGKIIFEIFNGSTLTGPYVKYKDLDIKLILTEQSLCGLLLDAGMEILFIYGNKNKKNSLKSFLFSLTNKMWQWGLKLIYFLERGKDKENPKIFARKIIAIAERKAF